MNILHAYLTHVTIDLFVYSDYPEGGMFDEWHDASTFEDPGVPLRLRWTPPSWGGQTNVNGATAAAVIADIDLLLTGGKLSAANRALLEQIYYDTVTGGFALPTWFPRPSSDPHTNALRVVLQHFSAVPEFHVTNNLIDSKSTSTVLRDVTNAVAPETPDPVQGYKAIVYLFMAGACDSFSMLAPKSGCRYG